MSSVRLLLGSSLTALILSVFLPAAAEAALSSTATDWNNFFGADGYIIPYTYNGQPIADEESEGATSPSAGGTSVSPANIDLSSGSPNGVDPGPYATPFYGYYNGGTEYDPADVSTMMDDYIMFRIRLQDNPADKNTNPDGYKAYHWNVLFDIDRDGYKEYWVDLDGSGNGSDNLRVLYNDDATQLVEDPAAAEVEVFTARADEESPIGTSHTRTFPAGDGSGDYFIDIQVPMWAFDDLLGNQIFFPDSPVAFVYSTGASNTDPLQKDYMMDIDYLSDIDPITFGDVVIANGQPDVYFIDDGGESATFYTVGDTIYIRVTDVTANTSDTANETVTVTVTNPVTLDDETVTLVETGPDTGVFTNLGGAGAPVSSNPTEGWLPYVQTASTVGDETWTLTYNSGTGSWDVSGSVSGSQGSAAAGTVFTSANGDVTFTLYEDNPSNGDTITFTTFAGDPLTSSSVAGGDNDGDLQVFAGDEIQFSYNPSGTAYTDSADIVGVNEPFLEFTRSTGLPNDSFELTNDPGTSDLLYVTVTHDASNTDPAVIEEITVSLSGTDSQQMGPSTDPDGNISTYVLVETGPDTGVFRNATGLPTQISGGTPAADDGLWEDIDQGVVTATFTYNSANYDTTATLFYTDTAGRVNFTNGAGTVGVERYPVNEPIFVQVTDGNACTTTVNGIETVTVFVTSPDGDSATLTLYETEAGNGTFMNRTNDLVTTTGSAVVTSASSAFVTDGVTGGDTFVIATGPDAGSYTVASVDSETQLTLTAALSASRTGIAFTAFPLLAATFDGAAAADGIMEASHADLLTVTYTDCDDGDGDTTNDIKSDTAVYNAPPVVINEVLFYPDNCQDPGELGICPDSLGMTEYVMLYNNSPSAVNVTGYTISDQDGWSYTVPQVGLSDINLLPGENIYIMLYQKDLSHRDFYQSGTYYLFADHGQGETVMPSDIFADPDSGDPADQITLTDGGGAIVDYVGWSSTVTPSIDFFGDDSSAVVAAIWGDDSYRDVTGIVVNGAISRVADGYDTDDPSDWVYVTNSPFAAAVTSVMVTSFDGYDAPGGIALRWETAQEEGAIGFNLYRSLAGGDGEPVLVNRKLLPAMLVSATGGAYRYVDKEGEAGEDYEYLLEEIDRHGERRLYGPFSVHAVKDDDGPATGFVRESRVTPSANRAVGMSSPRASTALPAAKHRKVSSATKFKLAVAEDGLYTLSAVRIAEITGQPLRAVWQLIRSSKLKVVSRGREIPWFPTNKHTGIAFYGTGYRSMTADENVYWLSIEKRGKKAARLYRPPMSSYVTDTFAEALHMEEDVWGLPLFFDDPLADYFTWDYVISGFAGHDVISVPFEVSDIAPQTSAVLAVHIVGGSIEEGRYHHAVIFLNGTQLGECLWQEREQTCSFDLQQGLLREGGNDLSVQGVLDPETNYSIFYLDSVDVLYERRARAESGFLLFTVGGARDFVVRGLEQPRAALFDVTAPDSLSMIEGRIEAGAAGYDLYFRTLPGIRKYLLTTKAAARSAPVVEAWEPTAYNRPRREGPEFIIITPRAFASAAAPLAAQRSAQGLDTLVVTVEDIMNEFNGGIHDPAGIWRFLRTVYTKWGGNARYVLLAGDGSWDYRDIGGNGEGLIPPALVSTPDGLAVSDVALADVSGFDGVPEFAVGRLPARSAAELSDMTAKILAYEAGTGEKAIFLADSGDDAGNFPEDSNKVAATARGRLDLELIYLTAYSPSQAKSRLAGSMGSDVSYLNFIGHGAPDRFSAHGLVNTAELDGLFAGGGSPVVTAMTCAAGRFAMPGYTSLAEALLLNDGGGAAAVWAPSGYSYNKEAYLLSRGFYSALDSGGGLRLGDVVLAAQREFSGVSGPLFMIDIYNLLGDPAMPVR